MAIPLWMVVPFVEEIFLKPKRMKKTQQILLSNSKYSWENIALRKIRWSGNTEKKSPFWKNDTFLSKAAYRDTSFCKYIQESSLPIRNYGQTHRRAVEREIYSSLKEFFFTFAFWIVNIWYKRLPEQLRLLTNYN